MFLIYNKITTKIIIKEHVKEHQARCKSCYYHYFHYYHYYGIKLIIGNTYWAYAMFQDLC